ncbi:MAG: hypothetical protein HRF43_11770 [Phycisphaerae bacterium]|jgi:hypothetical protein
MTLLTNMRVEGPSSGAPQWLGETFAASTEWRAEVRVYPCRGFQAARERLAEVTPSHDELLRLGRIHTPPQSWFEQTDDPFSAD